MNNTALWGYVIAVGEIAFAAIGYFTGWMAPMESATLFTIGLSTFGIHSHNVAVGRSLGGL